MSMLHETCYGADNPAVVDRQLAGLGACGCKATTPPPAQPAGAAFDLSLIPDYVWWIGLGAVALWLLKDNKSGKK